MEEIRMQVIAEDADRVTTLDYFEGQPVHFYKDKKSGEVYVNAEDQARILGFKDAAEMLSQDATLDALNEHKDKHGNIGLVMIDNARPGFSDQGVPFDDAYFAEQREQGKILPIRENPEVEAEQEPLPAATIELTPEQNQFLYEALDSHIGFCQEFAPHFLTDPDHMKLYHQIREKAGHDKRGYECE